MCRHRRKRGEEEAHLVGNCRSSLDMQGIGFFLLLVLLLLSSRLQSFLFPFHSNWTYAHFFVNVFVRRQGKKPGPTYKCTEKKLASIVQSFNPFSRITRFLTLESVCILNLAFFNFWLCPFWITVYKRIICIINIMHSVSMCLCA